MRYETLERDGSECMAKCREAPRMLERCRPPYDAGWGVSPPKPQRRRSGAHLYLRQHQDLVDTHVPPCRPAPSYFGAPELRLFKSNLNTIRLWLAISFDTNRPQPLPDSRRRELHHHDRLQALPPCHPAIPSKSTPLQPTRSVRNQSHSTKPFTKRHPLETNLVNPHTPLLRLSYRNNNALPTPPPPQTLRPPPPSNRRGRTTHDHHSPISTPLRPRRPKRQHEGCRTPPRDTG